MVSVQATMTASAGPGDRFGGCRRGRLRERTASGRRRPTFGTTGGGGLNRRGHDHEPDDGDNWYVSARRRRRQGPKQGRDGQVGPRHVGGAPGAPAFLARGLTGAASPTMMVGTVTMIARVMPAAE